MNNVLQISFDKTPAGEGTIKVRVQFGNRHPFEAEVPANKVDVLIAELQMLASSLQIAKQLDEFRCHYSTRIFYRDPA